MMTDAYKTFIKSSLLEKAPRVANEETPTKMIENRDDVKDQFHAEVLMY